MSNLYTISPAPHIRKDESTAKIMWAVALALLPAGIAAVWIFGLRCLYVIFASVLAAVVSEALVQRLTNKPITISDASAAITGILLAYNLPPTAPIWMPIAGSCFAILIAKQTFGGLGKNIFNPALAGRAFLMLSWPGHMTAWANPRFWPDGVSSATPLAKTAEYVGAALAAARGQERAGASPAPTYWDLFIGNRGGCIGEVCILAILIGAAFLLYKGYIKWQAPITYIFTTGFLVWLFGSGKPFGRDWIFAILSGGLVLGAFFMATDMVTTPLTSGGRLFFGLGCGILTFVIRKFGGYPEGVSYSILMMNAATPIIDRFTRPRVFGRKR